MEGDSYQPQRVLRIIKNRFGTCNDVAVLEMHDSGLKEVLNPSTLFLQSHTCTSESENAHSDAPCGSSVTAVIEGSRPLLVEIQALTNKVWGEYPARHRASGLEIDRLYLLLAGCLTMLCLPLSLSIASSCHIFSVLPRFFFFL